MLSYLKNLSRTFAASITPPSSSARTLFMQEFRSATAPLVVEGAKVKGKRLWTSPSGGDVEFRLTGEAYNIRVSRRNHLIIDRMVALTPGQGHGTEAMKMITDMADTHGVHLAMFMNPIAHKAMDMEALIKWSRNYGFEEYVSPTGMFWREPGGEIYGPHLTNG